MELAGKVALVTGASGAIGRAIALLFARAGADVVVHFNTNLDAARKVETEIKAIGGRALVIKADVSNSMDVDQMVKAALEKFGKIDILVNNAGISAGRAKPFLESTTEEWDKEINVNFKGTLNCCKAVVGHMIARKSGKIISISSSAGRLGGRGHSVYSGTKAAIVGFSKALAREVAFAKVTVNCISPSVVDTPTTLRDLTPEILEEIKKTIVLGRIGQPEDVANATLFLASDAASWITGQNLGVNGGRVMEG